MPDFWIFTKMGNMVAKEFAIVLKDGNFWYVPHNVFYNKNKSDRVRVVFFLLIMKYTFTNYTEIEEVKIYIKLTTHKN